MNSAALTSYIESDFAHESETLVQYRTRTHPPRRPNLVRRARRHLLG